MEYRIKNRTAIKKNYKALNLNVYLIFRFDVWDKAKRIERLVKIEL